MRKKLFVWKAFIRVFAFAFVNPALAAATKIGEKKMAELTYCVFEQLDFSPFVPRGNVQQMAYLLATTRSYISLDADSPGLLESFHFTPDGTGFIARVSSTAQWQDGTKLTPLEAAMGIAKGLKYTYAAKDISVLGTEDIDKPGWKERSYSGIEIVSATDFRLKFSSKVENTTNVVREILTSNSRVNRLWPARLSKIGEDGKYSNDFDVISKFPILRGADGDFRTVVDGFEVKFVPLKRCTNADFYASASMMSGVDDSGYEFVVGTGLNNGMVVFNSRAKNLHTIADRAAVASVMYEGVDEFVKKYHDSRRVSSFFETNEAGFDGTNISAIVQKNKGKLPKELVLWAPNQHTRNGGFGKSLVSALRNHGVKVVLSEEKLPPDRVDASFCSNVMADSRHLWIQQHDPVDNALVSGFQKTSASKLMAEKNSAVTVPMQVSYLRAFESAVAEELSFVPLARLRSGLWFKKDSPVELFWTTSGEWNFRVSKQK